MRWPLLDSLSEEERRELLSLARRRSFRKGEIVFHESDPGDSLHMIERGHVAVRMTTPRGDVATLAVLGPGDFFGEMALLTDHRRTATTLALDEVETRSLHRDHFHELRSRHPEVDRILLDALTSQVKRLSAHLLEALFVPTNTRVFRRLVALTDVYAEGGVIPLTQDDLASLTGATRPTVNAVLKKAEEDGIVKLGRGRIEIVDRERLVGRAKLE